MYISVSAIPTSPSLNHALVSSPSASLNNLTLQTSFLPILSLFLSSVDTEIKKYSSDFYSALPHSEVTAKNTPISSIQLIAQKQDLCQLVRDMVAVSEATNWSVQSSPVVKYRALRCDIKRLNSASPEYAEIEDHVFNCQDL